MWGKIKDSWAVYPNPEPCLFFFFFSSFYSIFLFCYSFLFYFLLGCCWFLHLALTVLELYRLGWPQTHISTHLCLPNSEIKEMCHCWPRPLPVVLFGDRVSPRGPGCPGNSQRSSCFCLPYAEIKCLTYHCAWQDRNAFFYHFLQTGSWRRTTASGNTKGGLPSRELLDPDSGIWLCPSMASP